MECFYLERKIFALFFFIIFSYLSQKCKKTQSIFSYIQKIYIVEKNGECLQIREAFAFLLKE